MDVYLKQTYNREIKLTYGVGHVIFALYVSWKAARDDCLAVFCRGREVLECQSPHQLIYSVGGRDPIYT